MSEKLPYGCLAATNKKPSRARGRMPGRIAPAYVAVDTNRLPTGAGVGEFGWRGQTMANAAISSARSPLTKTMRQTPHSVAAALAAALDSCWTGLAT